MASTLICKILVISILSLIVNGLPSYSYQSRNQGEKSDDYSSNPNTGENAILVLNRRSPYLGDGSYQNLHLNGKEGISGIPVIGISSADRGDRERYYIPMNAPPGLNKRSGKLIPQILFLHSVVDVMDFVNKNGEKIPVEERVPVRPPASVAAPERVVGGNMRFSGK